MSPYLFVLIIEVILCLMNNMIEDGNFKFNFKCDKERNSHLCIADDLLIFCKGELSSVTRAVGCPNKFKELSGLVPNLDKSNIFTRKVPIGIRDQLLSILGYNQISRGSSPPLLDTKLRIVGLSSSEL
jgi:hypothetical protein